MNVSLVFISVSHAFWGAVFLLFVFFVLFQSIVSCFIYSVLLIFLRSVFVF